MEWIMPQAHEVGVKPLDGLQISPLSFVAHGASHAGVILVEGYALQPYFLAVQE